MQQLVTATVTFSISLLCALLQTPVCNGVLEANSLFPFGEAVSDSLVPRNDDFASGPITLTNEVSFFNRKQQRTILVSCDSYS